MFYLSQNLICSSTCMRFTLTVHKLESVTFYLYAMVACLTVQYSRFPNICVISTCSTSCFCTFLSNPKSLFFSFIVIKNFFITSSHTFFHSNTNCPMHAMDFGSSTSFTSLSRLIMQWKCKDPSWMNTDGKVFLPTQRI